MLNAHLTKKLKKSGRINSVYKNARILNSKSFKFISLNPDTIYNHFQKPLNPNFQTPQNPPKSKPQPHKPQPQIKNPNPIKTIHQI